MNLFPTLRLTMSSVLCAGLIACAGPSEPSTPTVVRTPPPQAYETAISNYFAFRIRNPQKNTELSFGEPEPGACALDGYITGRRGWVVPVAQTTRTGEVTGKETVRINIKQYYFWFLGDTIAGITPRVELCPGMETTVIEGATPSAAAASAPVAIPVVARPDARAEAADAAKKDRAKTGTGQKPKTAQPAKKSGTSSGSAPKPATKSGGSSADAATSGVKPAGETSASPPASTDKK